MIARVAIDYLAGSVLLVGIGPYDLWAHRELLTTFLGMST
jgi:hypothetical protein